MKRGVLVWFSAGALAALGMAGEFALLDYRPGKAPVAAEGVLAALGGFRSLATEAVWFRADRLQEEGRYVELAQLASTLALLDPHTPEVWSYAAWNLAYNISVMMPTPEDRWRWISAAMHLLRDEGLRLNPGDPDLCRELAWLFQLKIGGSLDSASPLYREKWSEIVQDVSRRGAWHEIGMAESTMRQIERRYGIDDWRNPFASAIYWADVGLESATGATRSFLLEILRQSRRLFASSRHLAA